MQTQDKSKTGGKGKEKTREYANIKPGWPVGLPISDGRKISVSIAEDLAVVLTQKAFEQLFGWAYSTSREISCLGSVTRDGNRFIIGQFYLLKQSGSFGGTELDQSAVGELIEQLITDGKSEQAQHVKCWAHSHPNMDVFWSNIDDSTCRLLVNDYLISIVVANNFAIRCRIDIAGPVPIVLDNIPVLYEVPENKISLDKFAEQVRNTVSENDFVFGLPDSKQDQDQALLLPESYCECCGNWHAEGQCPLTDAGGWSDTWKDDDFMF